MKLVKEQLRYEKRLTLDVKTRWSSLYEMLKSFFEISVPLQDFLEDHRSEFVFANEELATIESIKNVLKPVSEASAKLGSDTATLIQAESYHKYIIEQLTAIDTPFANEIKESVIKRYLERRSKTLVSLMYYLNDSDFKLGTTQGFFSYSTKKDIQKLAVTYGKNF